MRGAGLSSGAGRAASILAPQAVAILYAIEGSVNGVMMALIGLTILQVLVVGFLGIDATRRSLESQFHVTDDPSKHLILSGLAASEVGPV